MELAIAVTLTSLSAMEEQPLLAVQTLRLAHILAHQPHWFLINSRGEVIYWINPAGRQLRMERSVRPRKTPELLAQSSVVAASSSPRRWLGLGRSLAR